MPAHIHSVTLICDTVGKYTTGITSEATALSTLAGYVPGFQPEVPTCRHTAVSVSSHTRKNGSQ